MKLAALGPFLSILLGVGSAVSDSGEREARLECRRVAGPGRALCEVEVEVARGRLAWADALVTRAPSFASPLRARVGPMNAAGAGNPRRLGLSLGLAALREGRGELSVRARGVQCMPRARGELCLPFFIDLSAILEVGPG